MVTLRETEFRKLHEKVRLLRLIAIFPILALSGCEMIGDIFQAGVWVGVLLVVGVIALMVWMFSRSKV
jgi:hypothetical protein